MKGTKYRARLVAMGIFVFLLTPGVAQAEDTQLKNRIRIQKKSYVMRSDSASEEYAAEKMELLSQKRRGLILDIKRFLAEARSADQKTELNLRLAALYMEDYYANLAKAQALFEKEAAEYEKNAAKKTGRPPKLDNSEAIVSLEKARTIYKDLATRYPKHPRYDEMLYFLAVTSMDRGKPQEAIEYFQLLAKTTPNSRFALEALVQVGDYNFENNQFQVAETYYDAVIAKKHKPLLPYTAYKKAWCAYNLQKPSEALAHFKWVIKNEDKLQGGANATRLKNEVLRDITLPFVDLRMMDEAITFFKEQGDAQFRKGIETMAQLYFEAGEYKNSVRLYDLLLQTDANHPKNPSFEISIVESLRLGKQPKLAVDRLFNRMPLYLGNSNWYEINAGNPQAIADANKAFEETALKYAVQYHAEAQKMKNEELYELSKQLYVKYLEAFPRSPQAAKIRFYLAEIQYKQEQYIAAANNYYQVYKEPNAGNLRFDAIRYALSALDRQLNQERKKAGLAEISSKSSSKVQDKEQGGSLELIPYSEVESKFIEIASEFLTAYPTVKEAPDVLFEQAYLQYHHHDFERAFTGFNEILTKYAKHATAYTSASLVLDILNRNGDYAKLIAACKSLLKNPDLNKAEFRANVSDILRKSELKRISLVENSGDFRKAADEYIEYTRAYGTQDEALFEKALYNASVNYTRASRYLEAVESQERFLRRFPASAFRENMLLQVAKTYELLANFEKSALYFEQFAQSYPNNDQARSALRLAGIYFWGAGNAAKAENVMNTYLKVYPQDAKLVEKDLLDLYETTSSHEKLIQFYQKARFAKGIGFADQLAYTLRIAEIYSKRTNRIPAQLMEEGLKMVSSYGKVLGESPRGIEAMSKLLFWTASQRETEFYRIKLVLPQATLERNMQRKLQLLKELEKEYLRIASLGSGEWGLGAIYRAAAAYQHLAAEIQSAPVPSQLSAQQLDQYRAEIHKQMVKPFREKAVLLVTQCLDKSQEFNLLSAWTPKCYALASELDAARFPLVRTHYLPPLQLSVLMPNKAESKIPVGSIRTYSYPFYSSTLFAGSDARILASVVPYELPALYTPSVGGEEALGAVPGLVTYRSLADERKSILTKEHNSEKPSDVRKASFAYLNVLRLLNPKQAMPLILNSIERDPNNPALHNLLALTYLELGNITAAKVALLSLVARGVKNAPVWNNLGVIMMLEGKEAAAIDFFNGAIAMEEPREAFLNLGYLALKYRNGFEAKRHFEKALEIDKNDVTAHAGYAVAKLQNRQLDEAKEALIGAVKRFKSDPYTRLAISYFLMDVEKEFALALRLLSDYIDGQSLSGELAFRQALQEAKSQTTNASATGDTLPDLD